MINKPLVTVGIPTYNRPDTLPRTLRAILQQTHTNIEVVISNNHSTIPLVEQVIKEFQANDNRIKYYFQEQPLRVIDNFSFVLNKANGDYFFWLADDDWVDNNYVEECLKALENDSSFIAVSGQCVYHDFDETVLDAHSAVDLSFNDATKRITHYYKTVTFNAYFNSVIRTDIAKKIGLQQLMAFDWLFVSALAYSGKIKTISTTTNHLTTGGMSSDADNLSKHLGKNTFMAKYFVGLTCTRNAVRDVFNSPIYSHLSLSSKLKLSLQVFAASYSNVWQWDYVINKRRLKKWWKNRSKQ